ncbi:hypothetical protein BDN67DRAFT_961124 [Paxillus ammoniavirescens]|nr:hypothetical protein BDN67DRAFT_961124 [Paxillus ammoniavirescens]
MRHECSCESDVLPTEMAKENRKEARDRELDCRKVRDEDNHVNPLPYDGGDSGPSEFAGA